jgi:hypothetical protein
MEERVMGKPSKYLSYIGALQLLADQSGRELATLMPHYGERGRIAEEIIKSVLHRTLPKRFSIGTGVIIASNGEVSPQIDIVIYDNFLNSPLLSEFGSCVFPVETVYATIEVKSQLTKKELKKTFEVIRKVRELGSKRHYVVPRMVKKNGTEQVVLVKHVATVPPRSYIVGFRQKGLGRTYSDFKVSLQQVLEEDETFVHGVCVLDSNWFTGRAAIRVNSKRAT